MIKEEVMLSGDADHYLTRFSPDGKKVAYIKDRRNLVVRTLETGAEVTLLDNDDLFHMRDGDKYFTWSPDSKWLLVDWGLLLNNSEVLLMAADGSRRENLTESGYYDSSPKWVNGGKQMIWFSNRDGLKSLATSGSTESDVYTMFFTQDAYDKYSMSKEDYDLMKAIEKETKKKDDSKKKKTRTIKKVRRRKKKISH